MQQELGELEAARETLQRALAIFGPIYRPEHPEIASTLSNLGIVQQELGELQAARETQQCALAIKEVGTSPGSAENAP